MDNTYNTEKGLEIAFNLTELGIELKENCFKAEKYLSDLRNLFQESNKTILSLQTTSKAALLQARRILRLSPKINNFRQDSDKLLNIIDIELEDFEETKCGADIDANSNGNIISEKINTLENKRRNNSYSPHYYRNRIDIDEKYPENWSKDSSIDFSSVVNLPPVPEDVFTSFNSNNKPMKSSSLSSLKSIRKVKLFLQRADNLDDEELSSDIDTDPESGQKADNENFSLMISPRKHLGNITEEPQDNILY